MYIKLYMRRFFYYWRFVLRWLKKFLVFIITAMALAIFACSFVILVGLSAHGLPVQDEWPEACKNYYYCWNKTASYPDMDFKRLLNGANLTTSLDNGNIDDRIGDEDIGDCKARTQYEKIYMIKELDNTIWYVAQTDYFQVMIETVECRNKARIIRAGKLGEKKLKKKQVYCSERRVDFGFPVLSRNRTALETRSPYKGIPLSCSAKIINTTN